MLDAKAATRTPPNSASGRPRPSLQLTPSRERLPETLLRSLPWAGAQTGAIAPSRALAMVTWLFHGVFVEANHASAKKLRFFHAPAKAPESLLNVGRHTAVRHFGNDCLASGFGGSFPAHFTNREVVDAMSGQQRPRALVTPWAFLR